MKKEIGERLTKIRNNLGMKKCEFADYLGVTAQYLSLVESGINCLSVEKLILLSQKTNISLDYILLGKSHYIDTNIIKSLTHLTDAEIESSINTLTQVLHLLKNNSSSICLFSN